MLLLESDLLDLFEALAHGRLAAAAVRWKAGHALGVVVAARGYPDAPVKGGRIEGIEGSGATVFHAGTAREDGALVASGGRVLTVCGSGETLAAAAQQAYAAIEKISFADGVFRRDIGWRAMGGRPA
jgi:phosphoribosylamine--glycine ligase